MAEEEQSESRFATAFKYFLEVLAYPPYYAFFYISSVLVLTAIITNRFFQPSFAVFVYSIIGIVWRHIHKDIQAMWNPGGQLDTNVNKRTVFIYHIGNAVLIGVLLYWLSRQDLP
jgi:hypothetical protein